MFLAKVLGYRGPFDENLLADLRHPIRREFLLNSFEGFQSESDKIVGAIDVFYMMYQAAHLKEGHKPKSMIQKKGKQKSNSYIQRIKDPDTGEMINIKVYY